MRLFYLFCIVLGFAFGQEIPEVVDMGKVPAFEETLKSSRAAPWAGKLAETALGEGFAAFGDAPEVGAFISLLQQEHGIEAAIEAGGSLGAASLFFADHFDEAHLFDALDPSLSALLGKANLCCHFDERLEDVLPLLSKKRTLFYLYGASLKRNLEMISKTYANDCILIVDDASLLDSFMRSSLKGYSLHELIPRWPGKPVKLVAIPRRWQNSAYRGRVDILSGFSIYDFPVRLKNVKEAGYDIRMQYKYPTPYDEANSAFDPDLKKIIVFGWTLGPAVFASLPEEKLLFFIMEPMKMPMEYYSHFRRVYTWDDSLVDNVKFFKIHYPYLMPVRPNIPSFEERKMCVMISGSDNAYPDRVGELYSERMKMVEFFETKPAGDFDIYGRYWVKRHYRDFRGAIAGEHSGEEKIATLEKYRFCICFENTKDVFGYITEKIFACFAAGCVPVYWGSSNVEDYIPKECFIDYRDFSDREELYRFMKECPKEVYDSYLENIRRFLSSDRAQVFSPEAFEQAVLEAIAWDLP